MDSHSYFPMREELVECETLNFSVNNTIGITKDLDSLSSGTSSGIGSDLGSKFQENLNTLYLCGDVIESDSDTIKEMPITTTAISKNDFLAKCANDITAISKTAVAGTGNVSSHLDPKFLQQRSVKNIEIASTKTDERLSSEQNVTWNEYLFSEFEPAWASSVTSEGDVFYFEPRGGKGSSSKSRLPNKSDADPMGIQDGGGQYRIDGTKQKKKKKKQNPAKKGPDGLLAGGHARLSSHSVTFNDIPTGLTKETVLYVDPSRHNFGRRATLCESLFGIIPGYFSTKRNGTNGTVPDSRIMVQGLLPGGEAIKTGIKIGEWLMAVNGESVDFDTMDRVLGEITEPQPIKIKLQKIAVEPSPRPNMRPHTLPGLVRLVSGEGVGKSPPNLQDVPHAAMYLTLDCNSENMSDKEDLVYVFPHQDGRLVTVRGMFITLCHLLVDVTNNTATNSTLLVNEKLVHVGYSKENREVMILALPADKICLNRLNHLVSDLVRILKLLYGSLHSAFNQQGNHERLDHLFALVFQSHLLAEDLLQTGRTSRFLEPFFDLLPGVRSLTIPEEIKVVANNCLSDLEAADFGEMGDDFYDIRRQYTIIGTCLFYKGYLLANHLHTEDLQDMYLYVHHHRLLTLSHDDQLGELLVWKEVFPTRRCHRQVDPLIPGFLEPEARWFLLIVGRSNGLVGALLEAGGCAAWAEGARSPDPFYVEQVRATLLQLEARDVFNQCQIRLQNPPLVSLACADHFLPQQKQNIDYMSTNGAANQTSAQNTKSASPNKVPTSPSRRSNQPESILKKRQTSPQSKNTAYTFGSGLDESDAESHSTGTSEGSSAHNEMHKVHGRKPSAGSDDSAASSGSAGLFKTTKKRRNLLSVYDMSGLQKNMPELDDRDAGNFVKLTTGQHNTLFHYVHLDTLEGTYICPTQQELLPVATAMHRHILKHFHKACISIRGLFEQVYQIKKLKEAGVSCTFGYDESLQDVTEHGILFECTPENWAQGKKAPPTLTYWVVGRVMQDPYPREFYVCFHDSAHQNLVEMAFKLGFGVIV